MRGRKKQGKNKGSGGRVTEMQKEEAGVRKKGGKGQADKKRLRKD